MIAADCHVHVYPSFNLNLFFSSAFSNFRRLLGNSISIKLLILTEKEGCNFFKLASDGLKVDGFNLSLEDNDQVIRVQDLGSKDELFIAPGFQMATKERLEVHGLFLKSKIPDGLSAKDTIRRVIDGGGVAGLPWSLGKWLGEREKNIKELVIEFGNSIFVGDSALRPLSLPESKIFTFARSSGLKVLYGSDPLPLLGEELGVARLLTGFLDQEKGSSLFESFKEVISKSEARYVHLGSYTRLMGVLKRNLYLRLS